MANVYAKNFPVISPDVFSPFQNKNVYFFAFKAVSCGAFYFSEHLHIKLCSEGKRGTIE